MGWGAALATLPLWLKIAAVGGLALGKKLGVYALGRVNDESPYARATSHVRFDANSRHCAGLRLSALIPTHRRVQSRLDKRSPAPQTASRDG